MCPLADIGGTVVNLPLSLSTRTGIDNRLLRLKDLVCKINKSNVCFDWFVYSAISPATDVQGSYARQPAKVSPVST